MCRRYAPLPPLPYRVQPPTLALHLDHSPLLHLQHNNLLRMALRLLLRGTGADNLPLPSRLRPTATMLLAQPTTGYPCRTDGHSLHYLRAISALLPMASSSSSLNRFKAMCHSPPPVLHRQTSCTGQTRQR